MGQEVSLRLSPPVRARFCPAEGHIYRYCPLCFNILTNDRPQRTPGRHVCVGRFISRTRKTAGVVGLGYYE